MKNITKAVIDYLKDWKNLLFHAIVGVVLVVVALYLPVNVHIRIAIFLAVIAFNVFRKRLLPNQESK
jgi:hypothetical protein